MESTALRMPRDRQEAHPRIMKNILCLLLLLWSLPSTAAERRDLPGACFADALPNREYAAVICLSHIESSVGRIPLPNGQNALYLRVARNGRFAGVGHHDDRAWLFEGGRWQAFGPAHGVNAVIFDISDQLRVATSAVGSQGYRFVDDAGRIWTGDETYADVRNHLWEWTRHGNVQCGQGGDEEGLQCLVAGRRVLVEPGTVRFVRFRRQGPQLALAWTAPLKNTATVLWLSDAELAALPTYTIPSGPPPPPPPPPPAEPELPAAVCAMLREEAAKIAPVTSAEQRGTLLNRVAWRFRQDGFGLSRKSSGNRCPSMVGEIACDILHRRTDNKLFDVLTDADPGSTSSVACGRSIGGPPSTSRPWVAPADPGDTPPPPPPPPPPDDLEARVKALEAAIAALTARVAALEAWARRFLPFQ